MSEITRGVMGMPYEMAMGSEMSRRQFYAIAREVYAQNWRLSAGVESDMAETDRIQAAYDDQFRKCRELKAENAGLRTGYEAFEQVNAELRAENQRLRSGMKGDYDLDAWLDWTKEAEALRKLVSDTALELRKASSWICREVEAGTTSATHWAIRLREKADQIDDALG